MMAQTTQGLVDSPSLQLLGILPPRPEKTWKTALFFPIILKMYNSLLSQEPAVTMGKYLGCFRSSEFNFSRPACCSDYPKCFKCYIAGLNVFIQDMTLFPTNIFLDPWNNTTAQLGFISNAIRYYPEIFSKTLALKQKAVPLDVPNRNNLTASLLSSASASPWNSVELISLLIQLSDGPCSSLVAEIFEYGLGKSPDLILLGLALLYTDSERAIAQNAEKKKDKDKKKPGISPIINPLESLFVILFLINKASETSFANQLAAKLSFIVTTHHHAPIILPRVSQLAPQMLISGLLLIYNSDPSSISRILDICQELKVLAVVLECKQFYFSIGLAALASRREYLNLEKWLKDHLAAFGSNFFVACLEFLNERVNMTGPDNVTLSAEIVRTFLKTIHKANT
jgi:CCR4-NOT transcription complex subunit 1